MRRNLCLQIQFIGYLLVLDTLCVALNKKSMIRIHQRYVKMQTAKKPLSLAVKNVNFYKESYQVNEATFNTKAYLTSPTISDIIQLETVKVSFIHCRIIY